MTTLLLIFWITLLVVLSLLSALRLQRSSHSMFELKRLDSRAALRREKLFEDVLTIRQFLLGILLVALTAIGVSLWQGWGVLIVIVALAGSMLVGSLRPLQRMAMKIYVPYEPTVLDVVEKVPYIGKLLGGNRRMPHDTRLESSEQLLHLVESAGHILTSEQQNIIRRGLKWHTTAVRSVMTPHDEIVSIKHTELLGPLVLDDLHRSGHTRFPVIRSTIDNVIGVLDIAELLEVDAAKKSQTAEKAMSTQVLRIEQDETLPTALAMLQKSRQHALIVIDHEGKTVGLLTLSDIMRSLLGHKA